MLGCTNQANYMVERGWGYVEITKECGSTGYYGEPVYCEACLDKERERGHAKHQCPHGIDLYPEDGRDIPCWRCESDEEEE